MNRVKRGKPRKRETQIMVGELSKENKNLRMDSVAIDKCLSPFGTECGLQDNFIFV